MSDRREFTEVTNRNRQETGAVIVFVTLLLVVLLAMIGLAFDIGHAYANKSQLQNIADASALAGASALNGTAAGIIEAEHRAIDADGFLNNRVEFNTQAVPIIQTEVTYSDMLNGPWMDRGAAEVAADTIRFVRTRLLNKPSPVFFGKVVPGIPNVLNLGVEAVAGQEPMTQVCQGLDPFSPAPMPGHEYDSPYFGYEPGVYYELRLAPGFSGGGPPGQSCSDLGLPGCVTGNFGMADSGGCGPSTPCWTDTIINGSRDNCVQSGTYSLPTTPGNMGINVPRALQTRYDQDNDLVEYTGGVPGSGDWSADFALYEQRTMDMSQGRAPYRRIIRTAFNDGNIPSGHSSPYYIGGFGCFWMIVRPVVHPPSSAICMMFVGECDTSGRPTGTNPSITRIVLFR